jgi:hypothetical protein
MFYYNLGGTFGTSKAGTQTAIGGQVVTGITDQRTWSGTGLFPDHVYTYDFSFGAGIQNRDCGDSSWYLLPGWVVHDGDIATVPEPETYAMLLAGLGLIGAVSRKRTTKQPSKLDFQ